MRRIIGRVDPEFLIATVGTPLGAIRPRNNYARGYRCSVMPCGPQASAACFFDDDGVRDHQTGCMANSCCRAQSIDSQIRGSRVESLHWSTRARGLPVHFVCVNSLCALNSLCARSREDRRLQLASKHLSHPHFECDARRACRPGGKLE